MSEEEYNNATDLEKILYDCTGMLAKNHPSIVEAMEKYGNMCKNNFSINKSFTIEEKEKILKDLEKNIKEAKRLQKLL